MRRAGVILLAIWAASACTVAGTALTPTPTPMTSIVPPAITPAPVGPPVRILWAPTQPQTLPVDVRVTPAIAAPARMPALVPASPAQRATIDAEFVSHFTSSLGFTTTLQNLRDQRYNGSEAFMFATAFAPGPFADQVRALLTTRRENEIRTFQPGTARVENAWVRPSNGIFGNSANIGLIEGTITFTDEVLTGAGRTLEPHTWRVRALTQGQFFIVDGAEAPAELAPMPPFDPTTLDTELAGQVAAHLQQETFSSRWTPTSPYHGTPYWDARTSAIDWLHDLTIRGTLSDRHFEEIHAQIVRYAPTSFLGDGYVTVHLRGRLVETMSGVRHTYPVDESVVFQRFSFAQAAWLAVDGQNDDGTWIANGSYGTPQPTAHG